jgi:hypothetical protein
MCNYIGNVRQSFRKLSKQLPRWYTFHLGRRIDTDEIFRIIIEKKVIWYINFSQNMEDGDGQKQTAQQVLFKYDWSLKDFLLWEDLWFLKYDSVKVYTAVKL